MEFTFHLFVQKHANRTYTVTPLPFFDLTAYGINLDEIKRDLAEALVQRVKEIPARNLHSLEFDTGISLRKVKVELRPIDRKTRKKRREQVRLTVSLLVKKDEDGQFIVSVPKLGAPPLVFYAFNWGELDSTAVHELTAWFDGMTLEQILDYRHARTETLDTLSIDVSLRKPKEEAESEGFQGGTSQKFWALRETGINLTAQAAEGRFRKTYRREDAIDLILKTLLGARNNSVLVTGPAEVGKSAVLHEVVRRIQRKECPEALHDREVWLLTPDRLIAGAQYIGTWEERLKDIVAECREKQHILCVEDLPGLIEIGRWAKSDQNVAQALKPHIELGEVVVIGEASEDRLRMGEGMAAGFINLFRRINLEPLSEDETLSLLGSVSRDLEREMRVRLEPSAIEAAVELARRFWPYRAFPGKAIRLLESSAADAIQKGKSSHRRQPAAPGAHPPAGAGDRHLRGPDRPAGIHRLGPGPSGPRRSPQVFRESHPGPGRGRAGHGRPGHHGQGWPQRSGQAAGDLSVHRADRRRQDPDGQGPGELPLRPRGSPDPLRHERVRGRRRRGASDGRVRQ